MASCIAQEQVESARVYPVLPRKPPVSVSAKGILRKPGNLLNPPEDLQNQTWGFPYRPEGHLCRHYWALRMAKGFHVSAIGFPVSVRGPLASSNRFPISARGPPSRLEGPMYQLYGLLYLPGRPKCGPDGPVSTGEDSVPVRQSPASARETLVLAKGPPRSIIVSLNIGQRTSYICQWASYTGPRISCFGQIRQKACHAVKLASCINQSASPVSNGRPLHRPKGLLCKQEGLLYRSGAPNIGQRTS